MIRQNRTHPKFTCGACCSVKCVASNVPRTEDDLNESVTQYSIFNLPVDLRWLDVTRECDPKGKFPLIL